MLRYRAGCQRSAKHLSRRIQRSKACDESISLSHVRRCFNSGRILSSTSAMEPPKISNFADVEEVRETSAPVGESSGTCSFMSRSVQFANVLSAEKADDYIENQEDFICSLKPM